MKLDLYEDVGFRCRCCEAGCCSTFDVAVTPEERAALEKLALPGLDRPGGCFLPGKGRDFILPRIRRLEIACSATVLSARFSRSTAMPPSL